MQVSTESYRPIAPLVKYLPLSKHYIPKNAGPRHAAPRSVLRKYFYRLPNVSVTKQAGTVAFNTTRLNFKGHGKQS